MSKTKMGHAGIGGIVKPPKKSGGGLGSGRPVPSVQKSGGAVKRRPVPATQKRGGALWKGRRFYRTLHGWGKSPLARKGK